MPKQLDTPSNDDDSMESDSEHKDELNGASKDNLNNPSSRAGIEDEDGSNSDGSEEAGEDEYVVEAIRGHIFVKGAPRYEVKWQGYPEAENTWESEANLQGAIAILTQYHESIGGVPKLKRGKSKQNLRKDPPRNDSPAPSKRRRKNGTKGTSAAADEEDEGTWTPSGQNWETQIDRIDTVEKDDSGQLLACILFKNGRKTKVGMDKVYVHCPVSMLKFYENHLKFK